MLITLKKFFYSLKDINRLTTVILIILVFCIFLGMIGMKLTYDFTNDGRDYLTAAKAELSEKNNFLTAAEHIRSAEKKFKRAYWSLKMTFIFRLLPFYNAQYKAVASVFKHGLSIMSTGDKFLVKFDEIYEATNKGSISVSELDKDQKRFILGKISESIPLIGELNDSIERLQVAIIEIDQNPKVHTEIRNLANKFTAGLQKAHQYVSEAYDFSTLFPFISGYPVSQNYLLLLQNSDELRPTGGFIGNYGIVRVDSGEVEHIQTENIYSLDIPSKDFFQETPPAPLARYLDIPYWYLRDSNWDPHFPASANRALDFYRKEGGDLQFDGVIAVMPASVARVMNVVGNVTVKNIVYTPENFVDLLEYRREPSEIGPSDDERKQIINDIAIEMIKRIQNLPLGKLADIWAAVKTSLKEKDILMFHRNEIYQAHIVKYWGGGTIDTQDGDYLMVVDANLGSLKTDPVIKRDILYKVAKQEGKFVASVEITYTHTGNFDPRITRYRTYTRVYVPKGAKLISSKGVMDTDRSDAAGEVTVADEFGKTYFGGFISIEPGKTGVLKFEYVLPETIETSLRENHYELMVQKQPGTNPTISLSADFGEKIESFSSELDGKLDGETALKVSSALREDKRVEIFFAE